MVPSDSSIIVTTIARTTVPFNRNTSDPLYAIETAEFTMLGYKYYPSAGAFLSEYLI
jgi:hypothetical protein